MDLVFSRRDVKTKQKTNKHNLLVAEERIYEERIIGFTPLPRIFLWNTNSLAQDLNSSHRVVFLRRYVWIYWRFANWIWKKRISILKLEFDISKSCMSRILVIFSCYRLFFVLHSNKQHSVTVIKDNFWWLYDWHCHLGFRLVCFTCLMAYQTLRVI